MILDFKNKLIKLFENNKNFFHIFSHFYSNILDFLKFKVEIVIEIKEKVQPYLVELMKKGILAMSAGKTILRLLPPAVISHEELDTVAEMLK